MDKDSMITYTSGIVVGLMLSVVVLLGVLVQIALKSHDVQEKILTRVELIETQIASEAPSDEAVSLDENSAQSPPPSDTN